MCACTEPVRTGIGAVYVEYCRPKWPITILNHTHIPESHTHPWYRIMFSFSFLAPYARTTRYEEAIFSLKKQGKKGSLRSRASLLFKGNNRTPGIVPRAYRISQVPGRGATIVQNIQKFRVRVIPRVWLCTYPTEHNLNLFTDISSGYGYGRFTELTEVQGTGMEVLHTKVTQ